MLALPLPMETTADELEKGGQVNASALDNHQQCATMEGLGGA